MTRQPDAANRSVLSGFAPASQRIVYPKIEGFPSAGMLLRLSAAGLLTTVLGSAASGAAGPQAEVSLPSARMQTVQERNVDLELVLAIDTSSSVSSEEFDLQMRGMSQAFRNEAVIGAIRASGDSGIAVAMVQWSDARKQLLAIDWVQVTDGQSAEAFAQEIDNTPRFLFGGGTALGGAISFSARQFDNNGYSGRRRVIDISGDGRTNQGARPELVRDQVVDSGVTINGLAILNEDPTIDSYYRYNVIGGTGAFVMTATDYEDFSAAMLEKLIKEISGVPIVQAPPPSVLQEAYLVGKPQKSVGDEEK